MTAPQLLPDKARSVHVRRIVGAVAAALAVVGLLLAAVTWGPHLARDYLASRAASVIGREVSIGGIDVQPFRRRIRVTDLVVAGAAAAQEPLLAVPEASAQVDVSAALRGRLQLRDALVRSPTARFARLAPARFSFQDILDRLRADGGNAGEPLPFVVEEAEVADGRLFLQDSVADTSLQVLRLQMRLASLSNQPNRPDRPFSGEASFTFQDAPVEVTLQGSPMAENPELGAHVTFSGLALDTVAPYLPLENAARINGSLAATADVTYGAGNWSLAGGSLDLADATLQAGPQQVAVVESLAIDGLRLDFDRKRAVAQALRVDAAQLKLVRGEQGRMQYTKLFLSDEPPRPKGSGVGTEAESAGEAEADWQYSLGSADLEEVQVAFIDEMVPRERRLPSVTIGAHAENLSNDLTVSVPFRASMVMGEESRLSLQGNLQPMPFRLRGGVDANGFDISSFEPYFGLLPNLSLVSAEVWGKGDIEVAADARNELTAITYRGELSINDVRALDNVLETDFVRWSALVAPVVSVDWQPAQIGDTRIETGDIAFVDFFGKAILDEEGRLNLKHVLDQSNGKPDSGEPEDFTDAEDSGGREERLSVRIGTLRVASGHINFTDNFIEPKYTVDLTRLSGSITGVASDQRDPADVSISGLVNGEAPLEIEGKINLLASQPMLDLQATARDIELTQLSPYAVRWAGYVIESGTLSAKVHYRIEGRQLEADNRFVLHQLKLGEKVQSPAASDLPLKLALSLLRDRQGNVALNLPITGSLTDPEFSFPGLVSRAVGGLFRKVATAPFSFLASIVGGGASGESGEAATGATEGATEARLDYVRFAAGMSTLGEDQLRKLRQLAAALEDRQAVGLQVIGYADRTADREGLRQERLESALRPGPDTAKTSGDAEVSEAARRERLLALYRDWIGRAVATDGLSTRDLEQLLLGRIEISEAELLVLARQRGVAAVKALSAAGLSVDRIKLLAPMFASESGDLPASRAHFEVVERGQA